MTRSLVAVAAALFAVAVHAAPKDGEQFDDWKTACETPSEGATVCHVFQRITMKDSGKQLLHVAVGYPKPDEPPVVVFTLPLGIALPPGVMFKVEDGEGVRAPFTVCTPDGCRAGLKLTDELVTAMQKGMKATLAFASIEAKGYNVPVSLKGFSKALASLKP